MDKTGKLKLYRNIELTVAVFFLLLATTSFLLNGSKLAIFSYTVVGGVALGLFIAHMQDDKYLVKS